MIRVQVPAPSCDQRFIDCCNLGPILFFLLLLLLLLLFFYFCVFVFLYYVHSIALENGVVLDYNSC